MFVRNKDGKIIALCAGYTYYSSDRCDYAKMWRCTKGYPCKARFKATHTGEIIRVTTFQHTHAPPSIIIRNGILIKVPKSCPISAKPGWQTHGSTAGEQFLL